MSSGDEVHNDMRPRCTRAAKLVSCDGY